MNIPKTKTILCLGGPLDGQRRVVGHRDETFDVGPFWRYEFATKQGSEDVFVRVPKSRQARRFRLWYISKFGKHPVAESQYMKPAPTKAGPARVTHSMQRAARREGASA